MTLAAIIAFLTTTRQWHVIFFSEHPMPGPAKPLTEPQPLRWNSMGHRESGADTFEEALEHLTEWEQRAKSAPSIYLPEGGVNHADVLILDDPHCTVLSTNFIAEHGTFKPIGAIPVDEAKASLEAHLEPTFEI